MLVTGEFVYIWEFQVKPGSEAAFEQAYGPDGDWVQLFRKARGYLRTELLRDTDKPNRYVTVDHWQSEAAQRNFRQKFAGEFEAIDKKCEALTESETLIGHFRLAGE